MDYTIVVVVVVVAVVVVVVVVVVVAVVVVVVVVVVVFTRLLNRNYGLQASTVCSACHSKYIALVSVRP